CFVRKGFALVDMRTSATRVDAAGGPGYDSAAGRPSRASGTRGPGRFLCQEAGGSGSPLPKNRIWWILGLTPKHQPWWSRDLASLQLRDRSSLARRTVRPPKIASQPQII